MSNALRKLPIVVLISGSGSNLQAIIDKADEIGVDIRAVISNRADAYGLTRAAEAGIETGVLDHKSFPNRESYETALVQLIDNCDPELLVLAGYMRILTPGFVKHYHGRLFNIHPSLLPKFRGLHTHQRALDEGEKVHGVSIHFVTEELDGGPLVAQAEVPVLAEDDAEILGRRVLQQEHRLYPLVIRWFAEGRLRLADHKPELDGILLEQPILFGPEQEIPER